MTTLDYATRCAPLSECRIGDWEDARFVFEWRKREGIQRYQPLQIGERGRSPFDEARFDHARPIWEFQRRHSPRAGDLGAHAIWQRIA
jgi:hypothetical protein